MNPPRLFAIRHPIQAGGEYLPDPINGSLACDRKKYVEYLDHPICFSPLQRVEVFDSFTSCRKGKICKMITTIRGKDKGLKLKCGLHGVWRQRDGSPLSAERGPEKENAGMLHRAPILSTLMDIKKGRMLIVLDEKAEVGTPGGHSQPSRGAPSVRDYDDYKELCDGVTGYS